MKRRTVPSSSHSRAWSSGNVATSSFKQSPTVAASTVTSRFPSVTRRKGAGILTSAAIGRLHSLGLLVPAPFLSRDEIAFDRVDSHAKVGGPVERPLNLVVFPLGLEDDPAVIRGDVG